MASILVTGSSGFVGQTLCAELVRRDYSVRAVLREPARLSISGCEIARLSAITSSTDWTDALHGITTVIHLAARVHVMRDEAEFPLEEFRKVNLAGTERLARSAAASGVKRMVYVSSIKVNGEETIGGRSYSEQDLPTPQDPYGISKWEAELALHGVAKETGLEVVIVRPPLVYGAGVKGNFEQMLRTVARGVPLPLCSVRNQRDLIYIGNLVDALIACATHPAAAGQTYLVSDGESISTRDLLWRLANAMGIPSRTFPFPLYMLKVMGKMVGKSAQVQRLLGSLRIDSGKIRRELNWLPPYTMQQGLQVTAAWYRMHRK